MHTAEIAGAVQLKSIFVLLHHGACRTGYFHKQHGKIDRLQIEIHSPSFDLGKVQNVIDQGQGGFMKSGQVIVLAS